jgi:hypothetical protein
MRRKVTAAVVAGGAIALLAGGAGPAHASSGAVVVTLSSGAPPASGGRTLNLYDITGAPLSTLDLSSGSGSFQASVTDSDYSQTGFTVTATMSNLYGYSNGAYTCSQEVPSSKVSLTSPSGLLEATGISGTAVPTFTFSGDLTSILGTTLLGQVNLLSADITNMAVTGLNQSLDQAQLAGGKTGPLIGAALQSAGATLPISLSTAQGGPFTNPAADPSGACGVTGTNATSEPIESGSADTVGLTSDLAQAVNALANPVTAATLVSDGWVSANSVITAVSTTLGIPSTDLTPTMQSSILGALTPTVSGASAGQETVSGQYSATPVLNVDTAAVPSGAYQGLMTVTLADTSS